jgi:hypothetical protein
MQNTYWKVAYSITCKRYEVNILSGERVENLQNSMEQISKGEQFLGLFTNKEIAYLLYERLLNKRNGKETPYEQIPFLTISKAAGQTLSYELVLNLIGTEFRRKPRSYLEAYCKQHSLPFLEMDHLIKYSEDYLEPDYHMQGPLLVSRVLFSLGYLVTMSAVVTFEKKDIEDGSLKISYYFTKKQTALQPPIPSET